MRFGGWNQQDLLRSAGSPTREGRAGLRPPESCPFLVGTPAQARQGPSHKPWETQTPPLRVPVSSASSGTSR